MRIINIPIEPLDKRYTEQWYRWFPEAFEKNNIKFITIDGEKLTDKIEHGNVLDVYGTHYYKFSQLQTLMKMLREGKIKDTDVLLFHDLWFPGIEALQYIRDMEGKKFQICGILHAGTWDKNDFTFRNGMRPWAMMIERGWLRFFDKVLLGSEYHKELIARDFPEAEDRLFVTGLPFDYREVDFCKKGGREKEKIVVFNHRLDPEKQPELFDKLERELKAQFPDWKFIKTIECTKNKKEYYSLLARSSVCVSLALQETFGYSTLESLANHCFTVVPKRLSYETMPIYKGCYYENYSEMKDLVRKFMKESQDWMPYYENQLKEFLPDNIVKNIKNILEKKN
jgi:glycosyltransferase involved in cell wall biosynthesis